MPWAKNGCARSFATGGKVPAVANLTLAQYVEMPVGTMFHSVTYGKENMGSYASQLTRKQRWMVIQYVKASPGGTGSAPVQQQRPIQLNKRKDSTKAKNKSLIQKIIF